MVSGGSESIQAIRGFAYLRGILADRLVIDPRGKAALDVGCGRGLLAEEFAKLGFRVTGIESSDPSLHHDREHAAASGLDIAYRLGAGDALPVPDAIRIELFRDVSETVM